MAATTRTIASACIIFVAFSAFGCGDDEETNDATSTTIGIAGGEVSSDLGTATIPEDALESETDIRVSAATAAEVQALPPGMSASRDPVKFEPFDVAFDAPVSIALPHDGSGDTVLRLDGPGDTNWDVINGVERNDSELTFDVDTFGIFVVTSGCDSYCGYATSACETLSDEDCASACTTYGFNPAAVIGSTCQTETARLLECYSDQTDAAAFACGMGAPIQTTCSQQEVNVANCVQADSSCYDVLGDWEAEFASTTGNAPDPSTTTATVEDTGVPNEYLLTFGLADSPEVQLFVQAATVYAETTVPEGESAVTSLRGMTAPNCPGATNPEASQELVFDMDTVEEGDDYFTVTLTR